VNFRPEKQPCPGNEGISYFPFIKSGGMAAEDSEKQWRIVRSVGCHIPYTEV